MFAYGIGLLPLIRALKFSFQRWIRLGTRDDAGESSKFDAIKRH
jgi:hypothetical protein